MCLGSGGRQKQTVKRLPSSTFEAVKRLGFELDCMSNYLYVTEEAISCNTINGSTYDLKTQQENLKKLSRFSLVV